MAMTFNQKIDNFTALLHKAAGDIGCVFYEDSGEGHEYETETMLLEDVSGWLAPIGTSEEKIRADENYRFAEWQIDDSGVVTILFKAYPQY